MEKLAAEYPWICGWYFYSVQYCKVKTHAPAVWCLSAVKQEKAELDRRESIEKFDKDQLKKTSTVEKNPLPDPQGTRNELTGHFCNMLSTLANCFLLFLCFLFCLLVVFHSIYCICMHVYFFLFCYHKLVNKDLYLTVCCDIFRPHVETCLE